MFNADLLCLFGFDGGWDVKEGFPCFGTVLYDMFLTWSTVEHPGRREWTNIFDFFHCKICIGGHTDDLWPHVHDNHYGPGDESLE
jgi:hypothetical protein